MDLSSIAPPPASTHSLELVARSVFDPAWLGTTLDPWVLPLAWLLGLTMGLTSCAITCLPALGALAIAERRSFLGWYGQFSLGRICAYATLATVAAALSAQAAQTAGERFHASAAPLFYATVAAFLTWQARRSRSGTAHARACLQRGLTPAISTAPSWLSGFTLAFLPCPALAALIAHSAAVANPLWGAAVGVTFGLGAVLTPAALLARAAMRWRMRAGLTARNGYLLAATIFVLMAYATL